MVNLETRRDLYKEAKRYISGGVNSPVRSFKAVGGDPFFAKHARGSKFYDEYGREFLDYCLSWGALILGHAHPVVVEALREAVRGGMSFGMPTALETELARLIVEAVPSIEQVRLTNSGTEAVMSAIRLARGYTKKDKIIKFQGSYHGHADYLLVESGSGGATLGIPNSLGVPKDFTKHTIVLPFNNSRVVKETVKRYQKDLAAIIIEPVLANCGVILPKAGFLQELRSIADRYKIVLIFDEVITGFRLSYGGAQSYFNVTPDLTCLGKIVGGGLPLAAFGGKRTIMQYLVPQGGVYQAGTLSGNPIAVTAGIVTLRYLQKINPYKALETKIQQLCEKILIKADHYGILLSAHCIGSVFSIFFTDQEVIDYKTARAQNTELFKKFFHGTLEGGVYFSPSGFEANFLSIAHTDDDVQKTLAVIDKVFRKLGQMRT